MACGSRHHSLRSTFTTYAGAAFGGRLGRPREIDAGQLAFADQPHELPGADAADELAVGERYGGRRGRSGGRRRVRGRVTQQ